MVCGWCSWILTEPDKTAVEYSHQLNDRIKAAIAMAGGALDFSDFMSLALYSPGLGYYSAGQTRFGHGGDFITAPLVSSFFAKALAGQAAVVLASLGSGDVLEFGAGNGQMAYDLLCELDRLGHCPEHYYVVDVSADLKATQAKTLAGLPAHLRNRVEWLDRPPGAGFRGVVIANEVLDALPVRRFEREVSGVSALGVGEEDGRLCWRKTPADQVLIDAVAEIEADIGEPLAEGYQSEWCPSLAPWVNELGRLLDQGLILLIDYGYPRREFYHPQRGMGTLVCHYRHHAHDDPFFWPGLQDITAFVDFTAVARAGVNSGLELAGFATQGNFLAGAGIGQILEREAAGDPNRAAELAQQVKPLLFPDEMGERFKVMAFSRSLPVTLPAFSFVDHCDRL
ncbi:MAG: SAM-dependent methyltransferase [Gammaproteobacteria bacterium]|nr:SAM-dependent methyltransferase [Gammaproteobacteria bacterium]